MSQSHIILVRHGEASANWTSHPDPGLSKKGRQQAKNAGKVLVDRISNYQLCSSPKKRALETMEIINYKNRYPVKIDSHFIEIPSENIHKEEKNEWLINIFTCPIEELPNSVKEWRDNLIHWVQSVEGNFVITTHFMVINALVSFIINNDVISYFHPDYASRTEIFIKNGNLKQLILGDDQKTVINL
tara:strand:+ start:2756 stop:3316 length:561 start_codon:yes stop_codon:yes gene_type:complete